MFRCLRFEKRAQYYQAARYYFQALQRADNDRQKSLAYAYISNALIAQRMPQGATYFFLKALGTGDDQVIRIALRGVGILLSTRQVAVASPPVLTLAR